MKFFDDLFPGNGDQKRFPPETDDGSVEIVGERIISKGKKTIYDFEVSIDRLRYVYIVINVNKQTLLILFGDHQCTLPITYKGFKKVYQTLSARFGFDDDIFFNNIIKTLPLKKCVWRKKREKNYQILEEGSLEYAEGFEIQSPEKDFIPWETTYDEMAENSNVIFTMSPFGRKMITFRYPVRIGNILFNNLEAYFNNPRTDVPVLHFRQDCYSEDCSDKSFYDLKKVLVSDVGIDNNEPSNYERDDQKSLNFNMDGMRLMMFYTYDSDWHFEGGETCLNIYNHREYPALLIDEYENNMVISSFMVLDESPCVSADYKTNKRVKRRPPMLTDRFGAKAVIWLDDKNNKIGFADKEYSILFDRDEIKFFSIQNILPAKGGGGAYLEIVLNNEKESHSIFHYECHYYDDYVNRIKSLTGKNVTFAPETYDC